VVPEVAFWVAVRVPGWLGYFVFFNFSMFFDDFDVFEFTAGIDRALRTLQQLQRLGRWTPSFLPQAKNFFDLCYRQKMSNRQVQNADGYRTSRKLL